MKGYRSIMSIFSEEIVPGDRIGIYKLGWNFEKLKKNATFTLIHLTNEIIDGPNIRFIFDNNCIREIIVGKDYKGKVYGKFGVGDKFSVVKQFYNCIIDECENHFFIQNHPGIFLYFTRYPLNDDERIASITIYDCNFGPLDGSSPY